MENIMKHSNTPLDKYVTTIKPEGAKHARTMYTCPICNLTVKKRDFNDHVRREHPLRYSAAYALLFGLDYPVRCECGKEINYSHALHAFPDACGACGPTTAKRYRTAQEAHKHVEQLKALLAKAKEEESRLEKESELLRIPLGDLPFPTRKDSRFLKRVAIDIRTHAAGLDKAKLFELANVIDNLIA